MDILSNNWLTAGLIDFEYKKYQLLAYFKKVKESFGRVELYPHMADLIFHYRNLMAIRDNKILLRDAFPKELSAESIKNLEVNYKEIIQDDAIMQELEAIMEYAVPVFKSTLDEGSFIYEFVESKCEIVPVGLTSLYTNEGYLFVSQPPESDTDIYRYQITLFQENNEALRGIHTNFLFTTSRTIANSYENMKLQLIKKFAELPNPSTYLVVSKLKFPYSQTLMPIAKRLLVKQLSKG